MKIKQFLPIFTDGKSSELIGKWFCAKKNGVYQYDGITYDAYVYLQRDGTWYTSAYKGNEPTGYFNTREEIENLLSMEYPTYDSDVDIDISDLDQDYLD